MRNTITLFVFSLVVIIGFFVYYNVTKDLARPALPVKLATGEYEPFVGSRLEGYGPVSQIVSETMDRIGYLPHIEVTSWPVALQKTLRREVFGTYPWIQSAARDSVYTLTDPLVSYTYGFFYLKDSFPDISQVSKLPTLNEFRVGLIAGYDPWQSLLEADIHFSDTLANADQAFEALSRGDIHFLIEGNLPGFAKLRSGTVPLDPLKFGFIGPEHGSGFGDQAGLHLMLPKGKGAEEFKEVFDTALRELKQSNWYRQLENDLNEGLSERDYVEIFPLSGDELIWLTDVRNGTDILVPGGTQAMVLTWPSDLLEANHQPAVGDLRCRVKLLNGPRRGQVFSADVRSVHLIEKPH